MEELILLKRAGDENIDFQAKSKIKTLNLLSM